MISVRHIDIYQTDDGQARVEGLLEQDSLWSSLAQLAGLFEKDAGTIGLYPINTFQHGDLVESSTTEDASVVRAHYSLADSR